MKPAVIETVEALDEMRAKAMADHNEDPIWTDYLLAVRAIRAADERAGLVTVHRESTLDMRAAMRDEIDAPTGSAELGRAWSAALESSPFAQPPGEE